MTASTSELDAVTTLVDEKPECLLSANMDLKSAALQALKFVFDLSLQSETPSATSSLNQLISSMCSSKAPQTRSQRKRKRSPSPKPSFTHTPLSSFLVNGMDENQLWAQLELKNKPFCDLLDFVLESEPTGEGELGPGSGLEDDGPDEMFEEPSDSSDVTDESSSEDDSLSTGGDSTTLLRASSSDSEEEEPLQEQGDLGLDDGFFSLNAFNAETEEAEARVVSSGHLGDGDESSDDEMSVDLFAAIDNPDNFDEGDLEINNSEVFYKDFFEPTPKISQRKRSMVRFHDQVQVKKIKATGKNRPLFVLDEEEHSEGPTLTHLLAGEDDDDEDDDDDDDEEHTSGMSASDDDIDDIGRKSGRVTIERAKNDLFAEDAPDSNEDLSTYERRQKAIQEEISALEAENTGKKEWMLMGEADSRSRPKNSLLEEDLDFEHVQKVAPVITQESVKSLEDRIKARILENRFDDVVRVRPVDDKPFLPSRFFELKDTKSAQSLSQIYEDEYTATMANGAAVDDRDGKLKQEHEEIEKTWEQICGKLDALCNAHFVPKQPKAAVSSIGQVSAVSLESALPTTKSVADLLAPEEIFSPSAQLRARSEMTPAEKRAARAKDRKAKQKVRDTLDKSVDKYAKARGGLKRQKQAALDSVIKVGKGVTVVGKQRKELAKKKRA